MAFDFESKRMDFFAPFNSINRDRAHSAEGLAEMIRFILTDGVLPQPGDTFFVSAAGGWQIAIAPGRGVAQGRLFSNEKVETLTVAPPQGALERIDRVVVRTDHSFRGIAPYIKEGTPSQRPVAPQLQRDANAYEMSVAEITVRPTATSITQSMIKDTRHDASVCGIAESLIRVDAATLFAQWEAIWQEWVERLKTLSAAEYDEYSQNIEQMKDDFVALCELSVGLVEARSDAYVREVDGYRQVASDILAAWIPSFQAESKALVQALLAEIEGTLGPDEAAQLLSRILTHESQTITDAQGVHGFRYRADEGLLQSRTPDGWVTILETPRGYRWQYIDSLDREWGEWNNDNYSWGEFENLIELEA